ncbi:MAG TPA: hypothetical protein VFV38_14360 [Ktedonobacteraceae bacterium]|nr:hypothetical protein [Ktedonobacteraceae bacterium]
MSPNVLQELRNYFGRDFLLGVFFPVLIFLSVSLAIFFEITQGLVAAYTRWEKFSLQSQLLLVAGGLVMAMVLSYLLYNFQYAITQFFEGYWPRTPVLQALRTWRTKLYRRRWEYLGTLASSASATGVVNPVTAEQLTQYPSPLHLNEFMPTRIGNILRSSEVYAYDRYGINSPIIWTRLRPLLAGEVIAPLAESELAKNFMLLMTALAVTFSLIWCVILGFFTRRWDLFLLCSLGWPLAWICYHNAVQSTLAFSERLKAIFDLQRFTLLKALGRKFPANLEEERKEWTRLSLFFYAGHEIAPSPPEPAQAQSLDEVVANLADYLKNNHES